ncbi:MAG: hypothetical protein GWO20_14585, partial [Candidatus Korarchaeota archaeon]|nr:hypothetical protein [Candidatus Korarchaeota archaeon]
MAKKKKYQILLELVNEKPSPKTWALSRVLMDCMTSEELYEMQSTEELGGRSLLDLNYEEILGLLEIPMERLSRLKIAREARTLKNYDVVLVCAFAGRLDESKHVMEHLRDKNPKNSLNASDFESYDKIRANFDSLQEGLREYFEKPS